jgi:hypothetical protein
MQTKELNNGRAYAGIEPQTVTSSPLVHAVTLGLAHKPLAERLEPLISDETAG